MFFTLLKNKTKLLGGGKWLNEHLPTKCKTLSSNPSTAGKKEKN
jgi:hypothetical protein